MHTVKYKTASGQVKNIEIDPAYGVNVILDSETVEITLKVEGPTYSTTYKHVGGQPKDPRG